MRKPIPQSKEKLELLHAQLDEWIRASHMRLMSARERSECYRASKLFWKTLDKLRPCVDYSTLNQECNLPRGVPDAGQDAIRRDLAGPASTCVRRSTKSCCQGAQGSRWR